MFVLIYGGWFRPILVEKSVRKRLYCICSHCPEQLDVTVYNVSPLNDESGMSSSGPTTHHHARE